MPTPEIVLTSIFSPSAIRQDGELLIVRGRTTVCQDVPMKVIMVPGINGSGPDHWQSRWEADFGERATRIAPASWDEPDIDDWCAALDAAAGSGPAAELLVVAHSLGCHAAAEWLSRNPNRVAGVFLVAPPDTAAANFPASAAPSFVPLTRGPIGVPGLMLYSRNDPYCAPEQARQYAERWQVASVDVGALGHINVDAGLEAWPDGRNLLTAFIAGRGVRSVLAPTPREPHLLDPAR
jgi:predicted alpha/beta hydrolase family esterase